MTVIQRKYRDHDPVKPWVWSDLLFYGEPVEVVSYPIPHEDAEGVIDDRATIMVRMHVGDPTSIREIPFSATACFSPDRHEWYYRPKKYYSDNPTAFHFTDGLDVDSFYAQNP